MVLDYPVTPTSLKHQLRFLMYVFHGSHTHFTSVRRFFTNNLFFSGLVKFFIQSKNIVLVCVRIFWIRKFGNVCTRTCGQTRGREMARGIRVSILATALQLRHVMLRRRITLTDWLQFIFLNLIWNYRSIRFSCSCKTEQAEKLLRQRRSCLIRQWPHIHVPCTMILQITRANINE